MLGADLGHVRVVGEAVAEATEGLADSNNLPAVEEVAFVCETRIEQVRVQENLAVYDRPKTFAAPPRYMTLSVVSLIVYWDTMIRQMRRILSVGSASKLRSIVGPYRCKCYDRIRKYEGPSK